MSLFADYEPRSRGRPPPDDLRVRAASRADVEALAALRVERGDAEPASARQEFERLLDRSDGAHVIVATVGNGAGDAVVGYGTLDLLTRPGVPAGWYLGGLIVTPSWRRRGIASRLTRERLDWTATRARVAYYFTNERNRPSIDLHARFGFVEIARDVKVPGVTFNGGVGLLFRIDL